MIERIEFASCYAYSPRGQSDLASRSRQLCYRLKAADPAAIHLAAARVRALVTAGHFQAFFGEDVTLIAVPGRAPLAPGAVSRTALVCDALVGEGLAAESVPLLERAVPVPKSAYAAQGERPDAKAHYDSLRLTGQLAAPRRMLLVDDVVTRGATLLGAASRLRDVYPKTQLRAFAIVRTESYEEIMTIRDPREGVIELQPDGRTVRRP